jgi:hypothetical protein
MNLVTKNECVLVCHFSKKKTIVLSFTILDSAFSEKQKTIIRVAQEPKTIHRNPYLKRNPKHAFFCCLQELDELLHFDGSPDGSHSTMMQHSKMMTENKSKAAIIAQ